MLATYLVFLWHMMVWSPFN